MILEDDRGEPPEKKNQEKLWSTSGTSPSLLDADLHGLGLSRHQTAELSPDFPHQLIHHDVSAQLIHHDVSAQ
ncbi:hypothetical protein E2C01_051948 [Portunus trituberculatus]|uniref:Uncharacterized protein n=1 Tax=Portunus trituberculatus TaxID=210409 RepID=A0A5B7GK85_PORTR|nr:hypothetical protein [Portunus trituberculatus]